MKRKVVQIGCLKYRLHYLPAKKSEELNKKTLKYFYLSVEGAVTLKASELQLEVQLQEESKKQVKWGQIQWGMTLTLRWQSRQCKERVH